MRYLRTLSTVRLLALALVAVVAAGGTAIAVSAAGGGGPRPPAKPLAQAIHDSLLGSKPEGITAQITFTNKLFPSGALGQVGSALMSGASGRLWVTNDGRGRIELQSDAGDVQVVWSKSAVTVYDASSNTLYKASIPAGTEQAHASSDKGGPPALADIEKVLGELGAHATISPAEPANVAGQPAYSVSVSPKHDGGLLASAALAWDAARGVPLKIGIYAQGSSSPVLELKATDISYGPVASSAVDIAPPAKAKVVDLGALGHNKAGANKDAQRRDTVSGLADVQAAAGFAVIAPDTLVGLPRRDVRLVGGSGSTGGDSKTVLVVYGRGLGAIVLVERAAATGGADKGSPLSSLPSVSLDGTTAHELATQLGTILQWQRGGTDFVLAGSLPPAAAEAAARGLK